MPQFRVYIQQPFQLLASTQTHECASFKASIGSSQLLNAIRVEKTFLKMTFRDIWDAFV